LFDPPEKFNDAFFGFVKSTLKRIIKHTLSGQILIQRLSDLCFFGRGTYFPGLVFHLYLTVDKFGKLQFLNGVRISSLMCFASGAIANGNTPNF